MEDLIDDDFGDIYADVEVQASSAINSISNFAKLYTEPQEEEEECNNKETIEEVNRSPDEGILKSDLKQLSSICEKSNISEAGGSDSEDDLNIVLNDEDCKGFPVAAEWNDYCDGFEEEKDEDDDGFCSIKRSHDKNGLHSSANWLGGDHGNGVKGGYNSQYPQYKHLKPYGSSFSSNNKVNNSVGLVCSSKSARGEWEDNRCKQNKISSTGQVANNRAMANSGGYGFSLPWYRTILDVNIDAFEEKKWKNPGVDISDFFNFGFNEESWKQYCISLEQLRQQSYMHARFNNKKSLKLTQAFEIELEHESSAQETIVEDISQVGSASKSADMVERQLELPKGRAIQVEDTTTGRQPTMDLRRPRLRDSDVVIQINVQDSNGNSSSTNDEELCHIDKSGLEASKTMDLYVDDMRDIHYTGSDSADESSAKSMGHIRSSSTNRHSQSDPSQMPLDLGGHDREQNSGADRYHHHHKVSAQTSAVISEEMETIEKVEEENGRNMCKSEQYLSETELSIGYRSHFSLTSSYSGSDSEASRDSICSIPGRSDSLSRRQSSGAMLQEFVGSHNKYPESHGGVTKLDDSQHYSRNRSPILEARRNKNRRLRRVAEGRILPDTDNDASPMCGNQLSMDHHRQSEKMHDFGDRKGGYFPYDIQGDVFSCYGGERFADNHFRDICRKHPRTKYHQSIRDEIKPMERRNWNEDNLHKRRFRLDDRGDVDRDWDCGGRGLSPEGLIPHTYRDSRTSVSKYKNFKQRGLQWRRKGDKMQSEKKTNYDDFLLANKNVDDVMLQKCDSHIPFIGRETNMHRRRDRYDYSPPLHLENSWCMETADEHWNLNQQDLPSWSHIESYEANEGRWKDMMSQRSEIFDVADRYGRHRREIRGDKYRGSQWVDNHNDVDNAKEDIVYTDDQIHWRRRKSSRKCGVLHQMHVESILKHQDDELYAKQSSCSYEKFSRHETFHANYRSASGGWVVDDMQLEWHRCKMFKGESGAGFHNRNSYMMGRVEHKRTSGRCNDPVDLIFGEGKSSGRCSHTESLMSNGKFKKMDLKFAKERKVLKDFNETQTGKAAQTGTGISKLEDGGGNGKWLDKFPATKHNAGLDIEEGQIVPEEPFIEDPLEKKDASGSAAHISNIKKVVCNENVPRRCETNKVYDDQHILDTLAKMEKRRERFKDPVAFKREPDKSLTPQADLVGDPVETKHIRPARKRRWK